jgi:hypothetical protein
VPLQPLPQDYQNPYSDNNFGPLFEQYKITYGKALEFVQWTLYDTVIFLNTATVNLSVFDGIRNVTTNKHVCNMPGNTLPDRQGFLIMALSFIPFLRPQAFTAAATNSLQAGVADDMMVLLFNGIFELRLYEKLYAQVPLIMLPAACGVDVAWQSGDIDVVVQTANNGIPDARNLFTLEEPVFIPPLVQIQAQLSWPGTLTLSAGNTPLKFAMGGLSVRPVQ